MNIKKLAKIVNYYSILVKNASYVADLSEKLKEKQEKQERSKIKEELLSSTSPLEESVNIKTIDQLRQQKEDKDLGSKFYEASGVWLHPFGSVHKDDAGFYILKSENPNGKNMFAGQLVADYAMNMEPYWKIKSIEGNRINLTPINKNPFASGIGAGGSKLTGHDLDVFSGKYEEERKNKAWSALNSGSADIDDVKYLLLGTVPVQMGPNGSQGGWYNPNDTRNNRGRLQGLSASEIIKRDASTLQQWGFKVPLSALNGSISTTAWQYWIEGNPESEKKSLFEFEDVSFKNINILKEQLKSKDRRIIRLSMKKILDLIDEKEISNSVLDEIIKSGGSNDYLSNNWIIRAYYNSKNIEGLKLCLENLKDNENQEVAYRYLAELDPEFVESNLHNEKYITNLYVGFTNFKDKNREKSMFDMKNIWAVNFIKNTNLIDKIKSFLSQNLNYNELTNLQNLLHSMKDSFGLRYFMDSPELPIFKNRPDLLVTSEEKNIYNEILILLKEVNSKLDLLFK